LGQVRPGMSGSPLLNQRTGKVCGIVKFTRDRSFDLGGGAIPTHVILEQFPQLRDLQQEFHGGDRRWGELLESVMIDFSDLLAQIETGTATKEDLQHLRDVLRGKTSQVSQLGKYNINIGQGQDIQIGDRTYVSWDEDAIQSLIEVVQKQSLKPTGIPENLPRSGVVEFVGRDGAMSQLHQMLQDDSRSVSAIAGMGGVGKTELAMQYALRYKQTYTGGICWLQSQREDVGTQIVDFARSRLQLNPSEELNVLAQVGFCWAHWQSGDVLVILDDVTNYKAITLYLPPVDSRFKVLITTRLRLGKVIQKLELDVLDEASALSLLEFLVGADRIQRETEVAQALCAWLGYLPLGIELVGRYLDRKLELSLATIQKRLQSKRLEERSLLKPDDDMTAHAGVAAAFDLSWEILSEEAKRLGCLLSVFALAPISWILVEHCYADFDLEELEVLRDDYLLNLHLLQRRPMGVYQLHQLIREFFQQKCSVLDETNALRHQFCQAITEAAQQIPEVLTRDLILEMGVIVPHLAETATALRSFLSDEQVVLPFIGLGRYYEGQGLYQEAENWYEQLLAESERRFGSGHLAVAQALSHLASNYSLQGRLDEAETFILRALSIRQNLLGSEHFSVADSLDDLAVLFTYQQRYEQAEPLCMQALEIRGQQFGSDHLSVAESLNNLASIYDAKGSYSEAEALFLQALELRKRLLKTDHADIVISLNNLANCYQSQGSYQIAETLYVEALEQSKRLLGEDHPNLTTGFNNLAVLYFDQARYEEAELLWLQALKLQKRFLGNLHPDVVLSLSNLASLYDTIGRSQEAESMYLQVIEMRQTLLGQEHPKVGISLNNLAKLYFLQERYEEAESLYERAITILEIQLGDDHPNTIKVRSNLQDLKAARERALNQGNGN